MLASTYSLIAWLGGIFAFCVAAIWLHRWLITLEERGYIYYRQKPRGGGGGALIEFDKLTRPSVEHIQKAMDKEVESEKIDGD